MYSVTSVPLPAAVGFSGHGFAIAPAVGRVVADLMSGQSTIELEGLSPARIGGIGVERVEEFAGTRHEGDYLE